MTRYCTLQQAKGEIKTSKAAEDSRIFNYINIVSRKIDGFLNPKRWKKPFFAPFIANHVINIRPYDVNTLNQTLDIRRWLLEINSITAGSTAITSKVRGYLPGIIPFNQLQLTSNDGLTWYTQEARTNPRAYPEPLIINGIWGWSDDYSQAWNATDGVQDNPLSVGATEVVVADGGLFSPGHLIRMETEFAEVTDIATHTLTITRGVNGSTPSSHIQNTPVELWQTPAQIRGITARQVGALFSKRGSYKDKEFTAVGIVSYPPDLLIEVRNSLSEYLA